MKKLIILFLFFYSFNLYAQSRRPSSNKTTKSSSSSSLSNKFLLFSSLNYSNLSLEIPNEIEKRTMDTSELSLGLGYKLNSVRFGVTYGLSLLAQNKPAEEFNNSNMSSTSSNTSVFLGYSVQGFNFDLGYSLNEELKTLNKNSQGRELVFSNKQGFDIKASYELSTKWSILLKYKKSNLKSTGFVNDLSIQGFGLGLIYNLF